MNTPWTRGPVAGGGYIHICIQERTWQRESTIQFFQLVRPRMAQANSTAGLKMAEAVPIMTTLQGKQAGRMGRRLYACGRDWRGAGPAADRSRQM